MDAGDSFQLVDAGVLRPSVRLSQATWLVFDACSGSKDVSESGRSRRAPASSGAKPSSSDQRLQSGVKTEVGADRRDAVAPGQGQGDVVVLALDQALMDAAPSAARRVAIADLVVDRLPHRVANLGAAEAGRLLGRRREVSETGGAGCRGRRKPPRHRQPLSPAPARHCASQGFQLPSLPVRTRGQPNGARHGGERPARIVAGLGIIRCIDVPLSLISSASAMPISVRRSNIASRRSAREMAEAR